MKFFGLFSRRTLAGVTFETGEYVGPVGGQYPYCQLLNPVGSGVTILVDRAICDYNTHPGAGNTNLIDYNTALTTLSTKKW